MVYKFNLMVVVIVLGGCESLNVDGNFTLLTPTDWPDIERGGLVNFTADLQITVEWSVEELLVVISGDTLQFVNDSAVTLTLVDWTLDNGAGSVYNKSSPQHTQDFFVPPNSVGVAYCLNITARISPGNWTLSANFYMVVHDNLSAGAILRAVLAVTALWDQEDSENSDGVYSSTKTIASNYLMLPTGSVAVESTSALTLPLMGYFSAQMFYTASQPSPLNDAYIEVFTSSESSSREVRLTLQQMELSTNLTQGVTPESFRKLQGYQPVVSSTFGSYQNNLGNLDFPDLDVEGEQLLREENITGIELALNFTVRAEDANSLRDDERYPVYLGLSFTDNAVWLGVILLAIEVPAVRVPVLSVSTDQFGKCAYDGRASVDLFTTLKHNTSASTGSAYNVTFNLYLPPYLHMTANTFTKAKDNVIIVKQGETTVSAEISRLTFSDPFDLELTLEADLSDLAVKVAQHRLVSYEVVYNDRWSNRSDLSTDLAYVDISLDIACSESLTWTNSSDCACGHDRSRSDCGCCVGGACQCGEPRPHACAPCDQMWRCMPYKTGFDMLTHLKSQDIRCDSFYIKRGGATGVSCRRQISSNPDKYIELSPLVGVVTAMDYSSGHLFGIANNGLSYVSSTDDGMTWYPFYDDAYTNLSSNSAIEWAEVVTPAF